jgi:hypothetical protein
MNDMINNKRGKDYLKGKEENYKDITKRRKNRKLDHNHLMKHEKEKKKVYLK